MAVPCMYVAVRTPGVLLRKVIAMPKRPTVEPPVERSQRDARLNLRTSARQQELIRRAAAALDKSVTDFVLESATIHAERVLADRRRFVLSGAEWRKFESLLDAPVGRVPKLRSLLSEPTVFDDAD
jgi:uncharacterized protein (DUF1778 family)